MSTTKPVIALTNCNMEKMSRFDLLQWINAHAHTSHTKVEELCSGVAYCQLLEHMFPRSVGVKRIKTQAKLEHEYTHNLKLLQSALTRLKFDNPVPIDRLVRGRFQDNFEYLQWFKKFHDTYVRDGKENSSPKAAKAPPTAQLQNSITTSSCGGKESKSNVKSNNTTPSNIGKDYSKATTPDATNGSYNSSCSSSSEIERCISPNSLKVLQESLELLQQQRVQIDTERSVYCNKVMAIEGLLKKSIEDGECVALARKALNTLYLNNHTDDDIDVDVHVDAAAEVLQAIN